MISTAATSPPQVIRAGTCTLGAQPSRVEDAALLDLELGFAQHALLLQRAEVLELGELGVHVVLRRRRRWRRWRVGGLLLGVLLLFLGGPPAGLAP
jgi:hypothetical protein